MTTTQTDHAERRIAVAQQVLAAPDAKALAEVITKVLNEIDPSEIKIADLKELVARYEEQTSETVILQRKQAEEIIGSLKVGTNGFVKLTIPAGLSDIDAMKALNTYFREQFPDMNRAAIWEGDLAWYAEQPRVKNRDISKERKIDINPVVEGTIGKDRDNEGKVLKSNDMGFPALEEIALVVAAYACKENGQDLLRGLWVRGAVSGVALTTFRSRGVCVFRYYGDGDPGDIAASGVSLSRPN